MRPRRSNASSRNRLAGSKWLSFALVTLLSAQSAGIGILPRASAAAAPLAPPSGILYTVDSTGDGDNVGPVTDCTDGSGKCTLRAAIQAANAHAGDDGIDFNLPAGSVINLTKALPDLSESVAINGPGADKLMVRRDTGGGYRIFTVETTGTVTFSGLTISNGAHPPIDGIGGGIRLSFNGGTANINGCTISGNSADLAGGIFNRGTLNVTDSTISGNSAEGVGGGIFNSLGTVHVTNSTFSGNSANSEGGGIFNDTGKVDISGSTFTGNSAFRGGGIRNTIIVASPLSVGSEVNVVNSTISGNSADEGGGINNDRVVRIVNSTISGNVASSGGGVLSDTAAVCFVSSSIIALNRVIVPASSPDVSGSFSSQGFNLIGKRDGSFGFTQPTDQTGTIAAPLDPKLDPEGLKNNGGPTLTIALQPTSPAVDKGTARFVVSVPLTTDQRGAGFPRISDDPSVTNADDGTDIGAFELNPSAPTPTPTPTPTPSPSPTPSPTPTPSPSPTPTPTPTTSVFHFDAAVYTVEEGCTAVTVRVLRDGVTNAAAAVEIASEDNTAKQKGDYTLVAGRLAFAAGETEKTFQVLINEDNYAEGPEFATLVLEHPEGGTVGAPGTATLQITDDATEGATNPVDDSRAFVCQHYHDFLYRQSDQSGENFWTQQIESCGASASCRQAFRVNVSSAFFLSIEFKETGYFVIRARKAAFGNLKSNPRYEIFLRDQREIGDGVIVGQAGFQQQLETNKQSYLSDFVSRPEFVAQFPHGQPAAIYVDKLFANVGATPTTAERNAAITAYGAGDTAGRAASLRSVIESGSVFNRLYNDAFVLMQYSATCGATRTMRRTTTSAATTFGSRS